MTDTWTRLFGLLYDSGPACLLLVHRRADGAALAATRRKGADAARRAGLSDRGWRDLRASMPAVSGWAAISFPVAAHRIGLRVVQRPALRTSVDGLRTAHRLLPAEYAASAAQPIGPARLRMARVADAAVHKHMAAAARRHVVSDRLEALAGLSGGAR